MAKARMKWNSTLELMGTSENLMLLNSAPMYSRKRSELAAWVEGRRMRRRVMRSFESSIVQRVGRCSV